MTTPRRQRDWVDIFVDESTADGTLDQEGLIDQTLSNRGKTLVRMIIGLNIQSALEVVDSVATMIYSVGIGLISSEIGETDTQINVGVQNDVTASGWLFRRRLVVRQGYDGGVRIEADIRAQRKLLYGVPRIFIQNSSNVGTPFTVTSTGLIRCLYLLP